MQLDVVDYVELKNGGAVVVLEIDEEARESLISDAIKRRVIEGLERMPEINYASKEDEQADIEGYIDDLARMEAYERVDSMESASQPSGVSRMDENEGEVQE